MIRKFRTKPVEIEAVLFTGDNFDEVLCFTGYRPAKDNPDHEIPNFAPIGTFILNDEDAKKERLTGEVFDVLHYTWIGVKNGQWIIKGQKGEFYPCDPETFSWKYEEV